MAQWCASTNAERELLRQLEAPVVLVISSATEKATRQQAPDFFTWAARTYALPSTRELTALAKQLGVTSAVVEPPVPEEEPIRFLHISDIHLRPQIVKRYDQDRVLRGLLDLLARDRQKFPLDLVFVTGDLANAGKADEYVLVVALLKRLMEVTGVPPGHVFVVPGNHDVDREVGRWLLRTLGKDEESVAFFEDAKSRAFHLKKLEAYAESMRALLGKERPLGLAVGEEAVEIVEVRGSRLAVASFNSAWFAQGDDDRGKLWLGEPNVNRAGQRIADLEGVSGRRGERVLPHVRGRGEAAAEERVDAAPRSGGGGGRAGCAIRRTDAGRLASRGGQRHSTSSFRQCSTDREGSARSRDRSNDPGACPSRRAHWIAIRE